MPDESLPSIDEILATHEEIEEAYDMKHRGIRVAAPRSTLREIRSEAREYDDIYLRAAHLLRKLITSHIFEDGNKRTAWVVTREYLERHDVEPGGRSEEVERVLVGFVATTSTKSRLARRRRAGPKPTEPVNP